MACCYSCGGVIWRTIKCLICLCQGCIRRHTPFVYIYSPSCSSTCSSPRAYTSYSTMISHPLLWLQCVHVAKFTEINLYTYIFEHQNHAPTQTSPIYS